MSDKEKIETLIDFAAKQTSLMDNVVNTLDKLERRVKIIENKIT